MSHALKFSGPFIKKFYSLNDSIHIQDQAPELPAGFKCYWRGGLSPTPIENPLAGTFTNLPVSSPIRRVYLILQNNTNADVPVYLRNDYLEDAGIGGINGTPAQPTMIIQKGQTVILENYNGPLLTYGPTAITVSEAFA